VAADLGHDTLARALRVEAEVLREKFQEAFWCDDIGLYALALDKNKQQCRVASSNSAIASLQASLPTSGLGRSSKRFTAKLFFLASEFAQSPDQRNDTIRCRIMENKHLACEILSCLLDSSIFVDLHPLPELFCGFPRRPGRGPTLYPVACSPQAWAAGAIFLLLQSCLGLTIRADESRVYFYHPALPESLRQVRIRNLAVGKGSLDLEFSRHEETVSVNVLRRNANVEIVTIK
jgi:glycogen debranching enzyme